jgi:hypothetical protein
MIQISIDFILIGITVLVSTLTVLYVYLVCKARIENIKQRKKEAYIAAKGSVVFLVISFNTSLPCLD